ncbi:MAG: hypothetical protein AAF533_18825 [Acidobacteriota bacterium]
MPILDIEIEAERDDEIAPDLAERLASVAGRVLETPPGRTWVRVHRLSRCRHAENDEELPVDARPTFVRLLLARWPDEARRSELATRLTAEVAAACDRPADNLTLIFEPPAAGRIAFGGRLVPGEERD